MELTTTQLVIVGLIASGIGAVLRLLAAWKGVSIGKAWMTVIVAVISMIAAVGFNVPALPECVDPMLCLTDWLTLLSVYVGSATIIYNLILDKVLDLANFNRERFLGAK